MGTVEHSISLLALSKLLKDLKEHHSQCFSTLPSDARTILGTRIKKPNTIKVAPGEYIHVGRKEALELIGKLLKVRKLIVAKLVLLLNIDGVRSCKSGDSVLEPILTAVVNIPILKGPVFPVGLSYGKGKPENMEEFLKPFIDEILKLIPETKERKSAPPN
ncbi:unnamed protein product [Bemisia tabaci]|uniref:Uncharacterized protein n=1 Tax=Bemisia tabaci TaxID=7038 RepID=A0A9P0A382_BEMTA|nr:unnamed protein product [Bemisia tabaci]